MRTLVGRFVLFALVLTIGTAAASAQITTQLRFKMSQSFVVENTTLPAGSYNVTPVSGTDQSVIEIRSTTGDAGVMVAVELVQPDASHSGSQLVFNKYKKVLALSEIFPGGENQGYKLVPGHPEKLAAKTEKPTKQTVAAGSK
jgi:hypothetical protein